MNKILVLLVVLALGGGVYWYVSNGTAEFAAENVQVDSQQQKPATASQKETKDQPVDT
jgi:uncharacterized protein HemX